jgi:fibronectin-binding autotransporter adhesin
MRTAMPIGVATLQPMKILKLLIILCGTFLTTAGFGQTIFTWTGGGDGTNFDSAANYGGTLPATASSDICSFNGTVPGNLSLNYSAGNFASGPGNSGISIQLTASQTGNVSINNLSANANPPNLAIYDIQIQSGAGAFSWGDNGRRVNYAARPGGVVHSWVNDSANLATVGSNIVYVAGGGTAYTMAFGGSGDWLVHSQLQPNNSSSITMTKNGTGTMTWNPVGHIGGDQITAVNINDGTLILTAPHAKLNIRPIANVGTFIFNAPAQAQLLSGIISGTGELRVNAGTLTLAGASTYSGNTLLNGGVTIINSVENVGVNGPLGLGGTISFNGGTLQFSVNNTFDYSPRFSTAAGQAYSIATDGQNVTLATALTSSGGTLTKLSPGTLTLSGANTYSGLTTVSAGKLVIQGTAGSGNITVANSAALGATGGNQITPGTLTVGTSDSATLEFNNVTSTATPLIAAGTVAAGGTITINVNGGTFAVGQDYPLLSWSSGPAPAVSLGTFVGGVGSLNTNGNTIRLNVTGLAFVWTGAAGGGSWDTTTANNWLQNGLPAIWANGSAALFDDTASGETNVVLNAAVSTGSTTVNANSKIYSITSSGANNVGGAGNLAKNGSTTLTLSGGANSYTGATIINGGRVSVSTLANGGVASDIGAANNTAASLVFNGGALQYTGASVASDKLFTLGTAGGAIDSSGSGAITLNNTGSAGLSGSGARTLTLTGTDANDNTLAAGLGDNGGPTALTKSGAGKWVLTASHTYSGVTTVNGGVLQIGAGGASGNLGSGNVVNNGSILFNRTGNLTVTGGISGTGGVTNDGSGTVILNGNNSYSGGTFINAGTVQFGTGGAGGSIFGGAQLTNNGTVIFNSTTPVNIGGFGNNISGTGNLIVRSGANVTFGDGNAVNYSGWTQIDPGGTFQPCTGNTGAGFVSSSITNNGRLVFISQNAPPTFGVSNNIVGTGSVWIDTRNQNAGQVMFSGVNTYSGGTFIGGGGIMIGDGITPGAGSIVGSIVLTNTTGPFTATFNPSKRVVFARPDAFTFTNTIISAVSDGSTAANSGSVEVLLGSVTLTGNNSYPGDTVITVGATLEVGNGGTSGSIGTGPVVNGGVLTFNRSDDVTIGGIISSTGSLVKKGGATLTLTATNTYTGATTVSNGTLVVSGGSIGGDLNLEGGAIAAAPAGTVATLNVGGSMNINSGAIQIAVNKSLVQSNTLFNVIGGINAVAGTVNVANAGGTLAVGDSFVLFNQPVVNGAALTITGGGATWVNNLAVDGSITVATVTAPPTLNVTPAGGSLQFSWTGSGYKLQAQTNSLSVGLSNNWGDYPGGGTSPVSVPVNVANGAVFFRLISTP